jgi:hypothetical protein
MDLYSATLNLNSKNTNQVPKTDLTATEMAVLKAVHGDPTRESTGGVEVLIDIKRTGSVERTDAEERERLIGTSDISSLPLYKEAFYRKAFPNDFIPLPQTLPGYGETAEHGKHPNTLDNLAKGRAMAPGLAAYQAKKKAEKEAQTTDANVFE